jgi:precorrin-3B synthase
MTVRPRGACPKLAAPMETGDGLLARIVLAGPMKLRALALLCAAAREYGNGAIEVTARGSLQVRGLTPASAPHFAARVSALGIDISDGVPVLADPLPDDPTALIDASTLAAELRHAIAAAMLPLAPKVSVIVDGGGRLHLDTLAADIRLRAVASPRGPLFHVSVGGDGATATALGAIAPEEASDTVLRLLAVIAAHGPEPRATNVLQSGGIAAFRDAMRTRIPLGLAPSRLPAEMIAVHALKDDLYALGIGLAFGHVEAHTLGALTETARTEGATWTRPAPDRTLLLWPFKRTTIRTMRDEARRLGFAVDPADPRRRIVACPGAPACASGLIAARALAAEIAATIPLAGAGVAVHVSGCAKGCAHPSPAPLAIVGTAQGVGLVCNDTARAAPSCYVDAAHVAAAVEELSVREPAHA